MFVKTIKLKKPNPIAIVVILVAMLILIAIWVLGSGGKGIGNKYKLPSNAERESFLTDLGWKISPQEVGCKVVKIPSNFNKVYEVYNKLQKEQGFDLSKHKGKTVEIYTYEVYNYPNKPNNIVSHLIVCEGVLIGGDVCSTELDGFMQGLMPINKGEMEISGKDKEGTTAPDANANEGEANNANATEATGTTIANTDQTQAPASQPKATESGFIFTKPKS